MRSPESTSVTSTPSAVKIEAYSHPRPLPHHDQASEGLVDVEHCLRVVDIGVIEGHVSGPKRARSRRDQHDVTLEARF